MAPSASFSVANINPGSVRVEFMRSIMGLVEHERGLQHTTDPLIPRVQFDQFLDRISGPYLDDERNRCVEWFLNSTNSTHLLFIDSDIAFTPQQAYGLIEHSLTHSHQLISGVYYNQYPEGILPVVYRWEPDDENVSHLANLTRKELQAHPDPTMQVDAAGAGFLAIHRDLLNLIGSTYASCTPWFAEVALNNVHMGEDMTFCVRAAMVGHPPHVVPSIELDHYKSCVIRPFIPSQES